MKGTTTRKSKLGVRWQLNAAMLSRPADLSALVTVSQTKPEEFLEGDTLQILVGKLLNCQNEQISDKDTKLDVLAILGNLSSSGDALAKEKVRTALQGVSEWFDDYLGQERGDGLEQEPELHKSMLLLLARAWDYKLKTEDVLELTRGNRSLALNSVIGVLEDGRTYATELVQSRKPGEGNVAQWEHELIYRQYEKPLVLQLCRLVRGFTHPASYFASDGGLPSGKSDGVEVNREELGLFSVDEFSAEMDSLLEITLRSRVIEKLSVALDMCLFQHESGLYPVMGGSMMTVESTFWSGDKRLSTIIKEDDSGGGSRNGPYPEFRTPLEFSDHLAVHCVHIFMQNLYHYATENTEFYRQHMLSDTLLVPRLILPYLDQCVRQARLLCHRRGPSISSQVTNGWIDDGSSGSGVEGAEESRTKITEDEAALAQGMASSLRTLVIASFRAPPNKFVLGLMQRMNPTGSLLRARSFVARHEYIFTLLCLLNVNMGALDTSAVLVGNGGAATAVQQGAGRGTSMFGETPMDPSLEMVLAQGLLDDMASIYAQMSPETKRRVVRRVTQSGALPVSRDAPGYTAILRLLGVDASGEVTGEAGRASNWRGAAAESKNCDDGEDWASDRKSAKSDAEARVRKLSRESTLAAAAGAGSGNESKQQDDGGSADRKLEQRPTERGISGDSSTKPATEGSAIAEAKGGREAVSRNGGAENEKHAGRGSALLGDLPSLTRKLDTSAMVDLKQQRVRVNLDLPSTAMSIRLKAACDGTQADGSQTARTSKEDRQRGSNGKGQGNVDDRGGGSGEEVTRDEGGSRRRRRAGSRYQEGDEHGIPQEFLCAINGHIMKQPARSPYGHVFELSTILLWLESRGSMCPLTGRPLNKEDLEPDEELRTRVMRWHIQKTGVNLERGGLDGDDIYDF